VDDLAGLRHGLDPDEVDPLDVPDHDRSHISHSRGRRRWTRMMEAVATIPPFERFYAEHRDAIFGFLARRLGRPAAEDAFQETFLRALRAYDRLEHGRHLRAWVFTIAARVATDVHRKSSDNVALGEEAASEDSRPAYLQLEHLADELPPAERTAVVLRYGYDLPYSEIGAALGSSADAARQAASSGIRRLRRKEGLA
jgi:RNA polymerase sigma factor (sigma-70 family)